MRIHRRRWRVSAVKRKRQRTSIIQIFCPFMKWARARTSLPFFSMKFAAGGSLVGGRPGSAQRTAPCRGADGKGRPRRPIRARSEAFFIVISNRRNILLDGHGEPLVSDFGLAKWLDSDRAILRRALTIFGTPGYIAPEQANPAWPSAKLTPAADVYSLGAILFDLLTGRPPFLGEHAIGGYSASRVKSRRRNCVLLRQTLDSDLETICAKCLERDPTARYRSAGDLAEDLERWLEGRSIIARPVSPPAQLWRWSKRNRMIAAMTVLSVALATVVGTMIWKDQMASPVSGRWHCRAAL